MSNRERLALILSDKMNTERAKNAVEVMDSFDRYIVKQGISGDGLYVMSSIIRVNGLLSRVKSDKHIRAEYKGKLFLLERGLFHYKNILVEMQNQIDAKDAWKEVEFEQSESYNFSTPDEGIVNDNEDDAYDEHRIAQMLDNPERFIRRLLKRPRME